MLKTPEQNLNIDQLIADYSLALQDVEACIKKNLASAVPTITQVAEHIVMSGGKRLRPLLVILAAEMCQYRGPRAAIFGTVLEYIHTATLLHDDVIDHADLRRGKPSANRVWDNKTSVLVGDFLYCRASDLIAQDGDIKVLSSITQATLNTTEGETLEVYKSRDLHLTREEYFKIVEFKTGVLMSCAMEVGAIIAGASEEKKQALKEYGLHLGISFQLADDALDYNSEEAEFGKANGIDLKEGKVTLPILLTLEQCNAKEKEQIELGLTQASFRDFDLIFNILKKYNSLEKTLSMAMEQIQKAKSKLDLFDDSQAKRTLLALADFVVSRKI